ncbi:DUF4359 domain-containing protein [Methylomicrobium album]|uniref:DUF4359 domain-containing protein n=1 Tax=Methylomicrobium album BG8 TaxID=686340 RepID=H8GQI5_METAL|nr:DUF4359 domain-containing protein [Methylomicrobium album]EIC29812.1 hypothetical protein Metal_2053 [Methylomicrobium album BG8]
MKSLASALVLIAVLGLLTYTNPKMDEYDRFISQRIIERTRKAQDPLEGMIGSVLGGFAAKMLGRQTLRKDYLFFSTYDTALGEKHIRSVGILNRFFLIEDPVFHE